MPELCCVVLHITIRDCNIEGPIEVATVTVVDDADAQVAVCNTDDTGSCTFLIPEEGDYTIVASYDDASKEIAVELTCGINDIDLIFNKTEVLCFDATEGGFPPADDVVVEVFDSDDASVGTCTISGGMECCIDIPGPGEYSVQYTQDNIGVGGTAVLISGADCGTKHFSEPIVGAGLYCYPSVCVTLCGCPLQGAEVHVTVDGIEYESSTNTFGCAVFAIPDPEMTGCAAWSGSSGTISHFGISGSPVSFSTGGDPTNVTVSPSTGRTCVGGVDPCDEGPPSVATAVCLARIFEIIGVVFTLSLTSTTGGTDWTYVSNCVAAGGFWWKINMSISLASIPFVPCTKSVITGTFVLTRYPSAGCTGTPVIPTTWDLEPLTPAPSICPFYLFWRGAGDQEFEVTG